MKARGMRIDVIVLAAGKSTRFGRNKLLEPVGARMLIERVVSEATKSRAAHVIVVGGHESEKVRESLKGCACEFVINEGYEAGQSTSIRKGLSRVAESADAVMVLPGDVAGVDRHMIDVVIDGYERLRAPIVAAAHKGRPGHPILFDRSLLPELREVDEETRGLKKVVGAHSQDVLLVETSAAAVIDIDTQDDLARLSSASIDLA